MLKGLNFEWIKFKQNRHINRYIIAFVANYDNLICSFYIRFNNLVLLKCFFYIMSCSHAGFRSVIDICRMATAYNLVLI